jgi:hypothetical protein
MSRLTVFCPECSEVHSRTEPTCPIVNGSVDDDPPGVSRYPCGCTDVVTKYHHHRRVAQPLRRVVGQRLDANRLTVEVLECGHDSYVTIQGTSAPFAKRRRCAQC